MRVSIRTVPFSRLRLLLPLCASVVGLHGPGCTTPLDSFHADGGVTHPDSSVMADGGGGADAIVPYDASVPPDASPNGPLCEGYDEVICPGGTPCTTCPVAGHCYDGICTLALPDCLNPDHPEYTGWPSDTDLEPNGLFELATTLPCGDEGVVIDPTEYASRCPSRADYTNGFMNLLICPEGERDLYGIYMLDDEAVTVMVLYQYAMTPPRDLDVRIWTFDVGNQQWRDDVAVGLSTNDDEQVSFTTTAGSGNPAGWYYVEVSGKGQLDINYYTVAFTLNP